MSPADPTATRTPTAIDALAEDYLERHAALSPVSATFGGVAGYDDRMPDLSPAGLDAVAELQTSTIAAIGDLAPVDDIDRVTVAAMREALEAEHDLHAARLDAASLNVIDSPVQHLRDVFDLMPTASVANWQTIATRMSAIPDALAGYRASLADAASKGVVPAQRQVKAGVDQCRLNAGGDGFFARFVAGARPTDGELPRSLRGDLERAAQAAADAYDGLADYLQDDFANSARERDAVGRDHYALTSRAFLGTRIDIDETYEWGQAELARITDEIAATAERITPGGGLENAIAALDAGGRYRLEGTDELQRWMQGAADEAIAALSGTHFDIPEPIRRIECMIAPTQQGGIYYTGPTEDLTTRPGRMWWSVPRGVTEFSTWRERTTVYHEGVPGHHLQIAQTTYRANLLNRWRRLGLWVSGQGEGWALYAERLMADLGYLDDPGDYLGMLDGQSMRAARVVLDIGIHCGLPAPDEVGGGEWDYDKAWQFLSTHANMAEGFLRFELNRYLGWPGQAPSYKIGERHWLQLREDVRAAQGADFDLKAFHRRALDVGSVGLDVLRTALL